MNRFVLLILYCAFLFSACTEEKKEISEIAVFISPSSSEIKPLKSRDKLPFTLDFYTQNDYIQRLLIVSFNKEQAYDTLLDKTWVEYVQSYDFVYEAPAVRSDSLSINLDFYAWDNAGNKCEVNRKFLLKNESVLAGEFSGIVLRSTESGYPDALYFASPSKTFNSVLSLDTIPADMYLNVDEDFNAALSSESYAKFVRNNSFDYAAATSVSIQAVYENSKKADIINDLQINDIVLLGHGNIAEGVLLVTNIIRKGTDSEKCVQLSFKRIELL